jgi:hypothetical protein
MLHFLDQHQLTTQDNTLPQQATILRVETAIDQSDPGITE